MNLCWNKPTLFELVKQTNLKYPIWLLKFKTWCIFDVYLWTLCCFLMYVLSQELVSPNFMFDCHFYSSLLICLSLFFLLRLGNFWFLSEILNFAFRFLFIFVPLGCWRVLKVIMLNNGFKNNIMSIVYHLKLTQNGKNG